MRNPPFYACCKRCSNSARTEIQSMTASFLSISHACHESANKDNGSVSYRSNRSVAAAASQTFVRYDSSGFVNVHLVCTKPSCRSRIKWGTVFVCKHRVAVRRNTPHHKMPTLWEEASQGWCSVCTNIKACRQQVLPEPHSQKCMTFSQNA